MCVLAGWLFSNLEKFFETRLSNEDGGKLAVVDDELNGSCPQRVVPNVTRAGHNNGCMKEVCWRCR